MENSMLSCYHREKGSLRPPIPFNFPEPEPGSKVHITKIADSGEGWWTTCLSASGIGRLFCFRRYRVTQPVTFLSETSEPAICLRLYAGEGSSLRYRGVNEDLKLGFRDNRLFWQGDRVIENQKVPNVHTLVELYFRPECLLHLGNKHLVRDLINQSLSESSGSLDNYVFNCSEELDVFLRKMLGEIDLDNISTKRFEYLCDSLLLMCLGENIEVQSRQNAENELAAEKQKVMERRYEPSPSEKQILVEFEGIPRTELLAHVSSLHRKLETLRKRVTLEQGIWREAKRVADGIRKLPLERLANVYMEAAYFLADWIKMRKTKGIKELLKLAIIKACEDTFELKLATPDEMQFYMRWSRKPYVATTGDTGKLIDLLTGVLPPGAVNFDIRDGDLRNSNLLIEQIGESLKFNKPYDFTSEAAKDKPKEVVELYQILMEHFCQTLEMRDGTLRRSKIVRELDAAYEYNDLVALLQVEAEYFAGDAEYIGLQDDEKLVWLIVALRFGTEDHSLWLQEMKEDRVYHDLQRFHRLGNDMDKFSSFIRKNAEGVEEAAKELAYIIDDIRSFPTEGKVVVLAEFILSSDSEE